MKKVYVITYEAGEYSDYETNIEYIFENKELAEIQEKELNEKSTNRGMYHLEEWDICSKLMKYEKYCYLEEEKMTEQEEKKIMKNDRPSEHKKGNHTYWCKRTRKCENNELLQSKTSGNLNKSKN